MVEPREAELYSQEVAPAGREYVERVIDTLASRIRGNNPLIIGVSVNKDIDVYPNFYSTLILGGLQSRGFSSDLRRANPNGSLESYNREEVKDRPTVIVDIHKSPLAKRYALRIFDEGASQVIYTYPYPTPEIWELQDREFVKIGV